MRRIIAIVAYILCVLTISAQHVERTMDFEGISRKYMEYIPTSSPDGTMPVVFLLHGLGDNCNNFATALGFENIAPNWIIITPEATNATISIMGSSLDAGSSWAAGVGNEDVTYSGFNIGTININEDVNDEGFILDILDSLENNFNVDTDSVFIAGFSMGGFMANKMAVKHADRITAIASVAGTLGHFQAFEPNGYINTMHIHGTSDETISYDSANFSFSTIIIQVGLGAEALVETWRDYNQCNTEPIVYNYEDTKDDGLTFEKYTYENETIGKKTVFIKVNNGIHNWYTGTHNDIDYNTEIYKFFTGKESETYTITVLSNNDSYGSVYGSGTYEDGTIATISAMPYEGYSFVSWDDGNTDNPRNIVVTNDSTFIANFEEITENTYTITVLSNNDSYGSVMGGGTYEEGSVVTISAMPYEGYSFVSWDDENERNPRTIVVRSDSTFIANFAKCEITYTIDTVVNNFVTVGDHTFYSTGNYTFTVPSETGCDTIYDLQLRVLAEPVYNIGPNPTKSLLNINSDSFISAVEFYSITGQVVMRKEVNGYEVDFDMERLVDGVYIMRIYGEKSSLPSVYKVVKE